MTHFYSNLERKNPVEARRLSFVAVTRGCFACTAPPDLVHKYQGFWFRTEDEDLCGPWPSQQAAEDAAKKYFEAL